MFPFESISISKTLRCPANDEGPIDALAAVLVDEIECGVIACDARGELRFANRSAREELASGRALTVVGDHVRSAALDAALFEAAAQRRRQLLTLGRGADRLMVSVIPLRAAETGDASVLIMLGRRSPCSALGLELLAMMYGLTLAERRVLGALLAEESPRRIAENQGVALSTVRSHIKAIRDKFGVHSIEGLLIRAAEVPPLTTAWRRCDSGPWRGAAAPELRRPALAAA
jgi:DNA-binding CsgD family transcriptional regulator